MAFARLQRWSLLLLVADALSRLPLPDYPSDIPVPGETIFSIESLHNTLLHTKQVANWTNQDPILSRVRNLVGRERSDVHEPDLAPYRMNLVSLEVVYYGEAESLFH